MANEQAVQVVAEKTETKSTAEMSAEVAKARDRITALRDRAAELDESIDQCRDEVGRAMALGDGEPKIKAVRARLREAAEEREAAERGIEYLMADIERLEAQVATVRVAEAADAFDDSRAEMDGRIEELRASLQAWIEEEFLPLYDSASSATDQAQSDERSLRKLNGETNHARTRVAEDTWGARPGLWALATAIAAYGQDPEAWAWKLPR